MSAASKLESGAIYDIQLAGGRSCPQGEAIFFLESASSSASPYLAEEERDKTRRGKEGEKRERERVLFAWEGVWGKGKGVPAYVSRAIARTFLVLCLLFLILCVLGWELCTSICT